MAFSEIETTTLKECVRLLNRGGWSVRQCRSERSRTLVGKPVGESTLIVENGKTLSLVVLVGDGEPVFVPIGDKPPHVTVRLIDGRPTVIKVHGTIVRHELRPLHETEWRALRSSNRAKPLIRATSPVPAEEIRQRHRAVAVRGNVITFIHRANFDRAQAPYKPKP